jgi:16S rRNA (uracil1498-N3)-methyltransferase
VIAKKAAQQCRRAVVPVIEPYTDFQNALPYAKGYDLKLLLWEAERDCGLSGRFQKGIEPSRICILIGPEGGFTDEEVKMARESGFASICLGPRILRTETAAIAIIAIVQYICGDLS